MVETESDGFSGDRGMEGRGILIVQSLKFSILHGCQILPIGSLISELFLFLLYDLSFPCGCFFSASMGISMGKLPKSIKWLKITCLGSKMVPKVSKWGF